MPVTRWTYLLATWAIAGFPWASGFFSKDEILWKAFTSGDGALRDPGPWLGPAIFVLGLLTATRHQLLHVPQLLHDLHRQLPRRAGHAEEHGEASARRGGGPAPRRPARPPRRARPPRTRPIRSGRTSRTSRRAPSPGCWRPSRSARWRSPSSACPLLWTGHEPLLEHWLAPSLPAEGVPPPATPPSGSPGARGGRGGCCGWFFAMKLYKDGKSTVPAGLKPRFLGALDRWSTTSTTWTRPTTRWSIRPDALPGGLPVLVRPARHRLDRQPGGGWPARLSPPSTTPSTSTSSTAP